MPVTNSTPLEIGKPPQAKAVPHEPYEALDRATIAELSLQQISRMTGAELVRVVRAGRLPASQARPEYLDRVTLERLAHLACLCCRNRGY